MADEEKEFDLLLEELRKQLLDACVHFDIWERLWPTEENIDAINRYICFFNSTRVAHLDRFIIKVCNVLSNDRRSPSFYRIFSMVSNNPALAPNLDVESIKKDLNSHKKVLKAIKQYRNKKAAHWDTNISEPQKPILFGKSRKMLKELQDIFNEISGKHSGKAWSFRYIQQSDTSALLSYLKNTKKLSYFRTNL